MKMLSETVRSLLHDIVIACDDDVDSVIVYPYHKPNHLFSSTCSELHSAI